MWVCGTTRGTAGCTVAADACKAASQRALHKAVAAAAATGISWQQVKAVQ